MTAVTHPAVSVKRVSLKLAGASGQGVNSAGPLLARGLKRTGYRVFGYREYPSLIQGGHSTYQLDVSPERVRSSQRQVDLLVALDHHGLEVNTEDLRQDGVLLHVTPQWTFPSEHRKFLDDHAVRVVPYPVQDVLARLRAKPVMANVLLCSIAWAMLGQDPQTLAALVSERFGRHRDLLELNLKCLDEGRQFVGTQLTDVSVALPEPDPAVTGQLLLTGSEAMGLGAVHGGVRLFASYPMTPTSPLSEFLTSCAQKTHIVVKQAEDEITAAQMVSGAMWMGARALTATAGVGFDLMTETISMNAMAENPFVVVLGQRPGPATGLPTWTAQTGLLPAVGAAHGEFTRCVLAVSNSEDSFDLMPQAFDLAEKYQIPVVVLTDKHIAEALFTQSAFDLDRAEVTRHVVSDPSGLADLSASDRYNPNTRSGVSARWLPGARAATYCAQADEHNAAGAVEESSTNAAAQANKRMRKHQHLRAELPAPTLTLSRTEHQQDRALSRIDLLLVGWGSTGEVVKDVLQAPQLSGCRIGYLHYTYLWPLRTDELTALAQQAGRVVLVEQNHQGQLGRLIRMECGLSMSERILKFDGRPFFYDELLALVHEQVRLSPTGLSGPDPTEDDLSEVRS